MTRQKPVRPPFRKDTVIISQQQQRMLDHLETTRYCVRDAFEQRLVREIVSYVVGNWRQGSEELLLFSHELTERQLQVANQTLKSLPNLFDLGPWEISQKIPALYFLRSRVKELLQVATAPSAHQRAPR